MRVDVPHAWNVSPAEARSIPIGLAGRVALIDAISLEQIATVAGVDNTYIKEGGETTAGAVVVVLTYPGLEVIATVTAWRPIAFPYVPGLLSFREAPAVLAACADLTVEPDVFLCDGQGYAHPRRFGIASHLGILLDRPTVGCAKTRLIGHYEEPQQVFGAYTPLIDKGETVARRYEHGLATSRFSSRRGTSWGSRQRWPSRSPAAERAGFCRSRRGWRTRS